MKKLLLIVLLAITPIVIVPMTGCKTSQQMVAYKTLATVGHTTDAAVKAYLDLVVKGTIPATGLPKVGAAYDKFQAIYNAALIAAQMNPGATATAELLSFSAEVLNEINTAKGVR